jgi:hypothetical protein
MKRRNRRGQRARLQGLPEALQDARGQLSCELIASPVSRKISRAVRVQAPFGSLPVGLRVVLAGIVSGSMLRSKIFRQASMLTRSVLSATTRRLAVTNSPATRARFSFRACKM